MRSFKDYSAQDGNEKKSKSGNNPYREEKGSEASSITELISKLATSWDGRNNNELLAEILREAEKNKRAGTLSNSEIDQFFDEFSPLLGEAQRRRLKKVVENLKKI